MTDKKVSPLTAGITGAVVGAGLAVAAAKLSDKKTREQLGKSFKKAKAEAEDKVSEVKTKVIKGGKKTVKKLKANK